MARAIRTSGRLSGVCRNPARRCARRRPVRTGARWAPLSSALRFARSIAVDHPRRKTGKRPPARGRRRRMHRGGNGPATRGRDERRRDTGRGRTERLQDKAAVGSGDARSLPPTFEECGCHQTRPRRYQIRPAHIRNYARIPRGRAQSSAGHAGIRPEQTAPGKIFSNQKRPHIRRTFEENRRETFAQTKTTLLKKNGGPGPAVLNSAKSQLRISRRQEWTSYSARD